MTETLHPPLELSAEHAELLTKSAIHPAIAVERGYRTITDPDDLLDLGFSETQAALVPGLYVPGFDLAGDEVTGQFRPDVPRGDLKYESAKGSRNLLDVLPRHRAFLANPSVPIVFTEGARKADALAGLGGFITIPLNGVYGWRGKNVYGASVTLGDFEAIPLKGRQVWVYWDSDAHSNPQVAAALFRFAEFLRSKGALVSIRVPAPGPDGEKVGIDDFLAAGGNLATIEEFAPEPQGMIVFHDAADLIQADLPQPKPIIPGLVYPGSILDLGGNSGVGKSPLTAAATRSMLTGSDLIGIPVEEVPGDFKIVWYTQESPFSFQPLLQRAGITPEMIAGRLEVVYLADALRAYRGKHESFWPEMSYLAGERIGSNGMLIVDTIGSWARLSDEDRNSDMTEAFGPLVEITNAGLSVWVNIRAWKSFGRVKDTEAAEDHIAGAGALVADSAVIALYKKTRPKTADTIRFFRVARNRFEEQVNYLPDRYVEQVEGGDLRAVVPSIEEQFNGVNPIKLQREVARDHALLQALQAVGGKLLYKDVGEAAALSSQDGEVKAAVEAAKEAGTIHTTGKPRARGDNAYTIHLGPAPDADSPEPEPEPKTKRRRRKPATAMSVPEDF